jgi:hypothetical protein
MINNQIVYQRGFHTITTEGLAQWHTTGVIPLSSATIDSVFSSVPLNDQIVNISIGIQATKIRSYSGEHSNLQEVYFDNIKLNMKTAVNGTATGINLKIDGHSVIDSPSQWGKSTLTLFNIWDENPIQVNLTTDAIKIDFTIISTLYAYHGGNSTLEEYGTQGSNLIIYTNNSVFWETYYRTYIPLYYENYTFTGYKPSDWEIQGVYNPIGSGTAFIGGEKGAASFTIEHPNADYPGWWNFIAKSTNMLNKSSTSLWNGTGWQSYVDPIYFNISDKVRIRTSLNTSFGNIENYASTTANITIYDPDGEIWFNGEIIPEISGEIQFPDVTIGSLNSSAGKYKYRIFWMNGTSAGGLNGSFYVYRNLQATILYPRDAFGDLETEAILGDIIPFRVKLNDSVSGDIATNMHVSYIWESGSNSLTEIIAGNYDGNFDTLDIENPGSHEINFTIWGSGYYNLSFTLTINLFEETELKIVGLDNNIDYGTNFSIDITYKSKPLLIGISDANVVLNLSSSVYSVTDSGEMGKYKIEISSIDAFSGAGSYDIQINVSAKDSQPQDIVTRIQVLPRSVHFEILFNSVDISFNKSYSTPVKQILNISVGVKASSDNSPILSGTVYMTDGQYIHDDFSIVGNYYSMEINSSYFGLGVRFISIIFNETTYQSASNIVMLTVTRLPMSASLSETEPVLREERNTEFNVLIYVEDPITHLPITDVNVAYDWIFGRGFLTNLGNGYFELQETVPRELGTYIITITITSPNIDYEPSTISVTLVSQLPEGYSNLWWILLIVGSIALITVGILGYIGYKRNVLVPKREQEFNLLKKKTQVFDDITNIKSILIIETGTGRLMYQQNFGGLNRDLEDIFSGFLHSILTLSNKFALKNGELGSKREYAEFTHESFHVLVASGTKVLLALILEHESSPELQERAFRFLDEFEGIYKSIFGAWVGDRTVFKDTTPKLFEEIFHLSLMGRFMISEVQNVHLIEKTLATPGTLSEKLIQIIKTVSEERHDFLLKTIISLVPQNQQLQAKEVLLRFIKSHYIVPVTDDKS